MTAPKPSWVWDELSDELRAESWRRLAAWVDWLEQACDQQELPLIAIKVHPIYDPLRNESRFQSLLGRLHF